MAISGGISESNTENYPLSGQLILVVGHNYPESNSTAAGVRMLQLIQGFRRQGAILHFATTSRPGRYSDSLEKLVKRVHQIQLNDPAFDRLIRKYEFDMVVFDRFMTEEQFGWRIRSQLPECRLILDTEDLHSLRLSRQKAVEKGIDWSEELWYSHPVFFRELASIIRSDISLIISRVELNMLIDIFPWLASQLVYAPFQMEPGDSDDTRSFDTRKHFVFAGNGKHPPNADAVEILRSVVWPKLSQLCPEAELHIYGAYLEQNLSNPDNFPGEDRLYFKGFVPEVGEVFRSARLQLAPLRFGAGVKGKIITGLQHGLPTVSTLIGWEGIGEDIANNPLCVENLGAMIEQAANLYQKKEKWEHALHTGFKLAREHFRDSGSSDWISSNLMEEAELNREGKLIRDLLRSKAFDSSRFMSKWIEIKNKKL